MNSSIFFMENAEQSIWGSITEEDEAGIEAAVASASLHPGPIVEIGALFGHTTTLLATLKGTDTQLIAVENFTWNPFFLSDDEHRQFTKRSLRYILKNCSTSIYDGSAEGFYSANQDMKPSMVFIDAGHDYGSVRRDIDWAMQSGCPVISGHDYHKEIHPGVVKAVDESFGSDVRIFGSVWLHVSEGLQS
ncbi:class I SAM-dependent methyltransferase [Haloferula sp. A504]|uniref:class I SAM-dependent methyltransferase n=1 Tax=Haloferula sp. A504 TaxID=3373601 RepID=UPI0031C5ED78|nr:class I SAM-dependent methyltransferase [Verrucomicrobiaceae bacterium E54]